MKSITKKRFTKIAIFSLVAVLFLSAGCRTIEKVQYVDRWHENNTVRVDSVVVNNTDTFKIIQRGDTVFVTDIKWRVRDVVKIERDTTVQIEKEVVTETVTITNTKRIRDVFWWIGLVGSIIIVTFVAYKIYRKFG